MGIVVAPGRAYATAGWGNANMATATTGETTRHATDLATDQGDVRSQRTHSKGPTMSIEIGPIFDGMQNQIGPDSTGSASQARRNWPGNDPAAQAHHQGILKFWEKFKATHGLPGDMPLPVINGMPVTDPIQITQWFANMPPDQQSGQAGRAPLLGGRSIAGQGPRPTDPNILYSPARTPGNPFSATGGADLTGGTGGHAAGAAAPQSAANPIAPIQPLTPTPTTTAGQQTGAPTTSQPASAPLPNQLDKTTTKFTGGSLDPMHTGRTKPFLAKAFAAGYGVPAGVKTLADYRRQADPGHVEDTASATPDDQIQTVNDYRRIASAFHSGSLDPQIEAKLTDHDRALLGNTPPTTPEQPEAPQAAPQLQAPAPAPTNHSEPAEAVELQEGLDTIRVPSNELREQTRRELEEALHGWHGLTANGIDALVDLAAIVGVEAVVSNPALVHALATGEPERIAEVLEVYGDVLTNAEMDDYLEGMESIAHEAAETPRPVVNRPQPGDDADDTTQAVADEGEPTHRQPVRRADRESEAGPIAADVDQAVAPQAATRSAPVVSRPPNTISSTASPRPAEQRAKHWPVDAYEFQDLYPEPGDNPNKTDDSDVYRPGVRGPFSPPAPGEEPEYETEVDFEEVANDLAQPDEEGFIPVTKKVGKRLTIGYGTDLHNNKNFIVQQLGRLGMAAEEAGRLYDAWTHPIHEERPPIDPVLARGLLRLYVEDSVGEVRSWLGRDQHGRYVYDLLPAQAKSVLSKLHYQMGLDTLTEFTKTRDALRAFDFDAAGWEIWQSIDGRNYEPRRNMSGLPIRRRMHTREMQEVTQQIWNAMYDSPETT